mmetsp:Transcript_22311/g.73925  ORF Transcript_22311/g.73925 Transcript_22311/m.73925 type:complete len:99 (+) Transcript_22311:111-407(+)
MESPMLREEVLPAARAARAAVGPRPALRHETGERLGDVDHLHQGREMLEQHRRRRRAARRFATRPRRLRFPAQWRLPERDDDESGGLCESRDIREVHA